MKYTRKRCKIISLLLVLALISTLVLPVSAESYPVSLSIQCNGIAYNLDVVKNDGKWFTEISSLSNIGRCEYSINGENQVASLYKREPFVVLYSISLDLCYIRNGCYYVPLEEASVAVGIHFYGDEPLRAVVYRTPKQMVAEFDEIFYDQRYQMTQLLLTDGYWLSESLARLYTIMPFVGSGSLIGAVSGEDEENRYRTAFASILINDGSTTDFMLSTAEVSGEVHKNAEIIKAVKDLTKKDGELYEILLSTGVNPELLDVLAYEEDPYDPLDSLFEDWSSVLSAINFEHFLDLCTFYAVSVDTEESVLVAMKRVFENSGNEKSREAVERLIDAHYGEGYIALSDIYGGMIWDISMEYINENAEELYYGGYAVGAGLIARGVDTVFQASSIADAYIYFPIYASIQQDLYNYYCIHRDDTQDHTMYDLRAVVIMYLKAAIAAYEYAGFDDDLAGTLDLAISVLNYELANVLSYSDAEYAPDYTNSEFVELLDKLYSLESAPEYPVADVRSAYEAVCASGLYLENANGEGILATHYHLFDMNQDGIPEMIAYAVDIDVPVFGIYSFINGSVKEIADSVHSCELSHWYNAGHNVSIYDGKYVFASASKVGATYVAYFAALLAYDGKSIYDIDTNYKPSSIQELIRDARIEGGTEIRHSTSPYVLPSDPGISDGEYYGHLESWTSDTMTVELLSFGGHHESQNYILNPTGQHVTLDTSRATVQLEWFWNLQDVQCSSIDDALNYEIDGWGGTKIKDASTMEIFFTVSNGKVTLIEFLYAA